MTQEQLLKPRYKVVADYPGNRFKIGAVFKKDIDGTYVDEDNNVTLESNLTTFVRLFKKLSWWEDRKPEDFPEFVVYKWSEKAKPLIVKIEKLFTDSNGDSNNYGFVDQLGEYRAFSRTTPLPETPAT